VPAFVAELQASKQIDKGKKEITTQQNKINQKIEKIIKNPSGNDPVYKILQRLFNHDSPFNLDRSKKQRFTIRNLARKRFVLGYPPRKKEDNSIGDAINWEWIIQCAQDSGRDIIIVTRDSDYGAILKNESFLNDWLKKEFSERVSRKRKIILTERLSAAFKMVKFTVSKVMEEEEEKVIESQEKKSSDATTEPLAVRVLRLLEEFKKIQK
jgi:hypothetical protein